MVISAFVCLIWVNLVFGRKSFWRVSETAPLPAPAKKPIVTAVIPARNEAEVIGRAVGSLLASDYPLNIVVVDDHSTDGTASAAGVHLNLAVLQAPALEAGWTGKLWAVSNGVQEASKQSPDYYLLTDADIEHSPGNVSQLVARAEAGGFDMVSLMVKLRCESFAEKALIPAFVFFFFKLYPPGADTNGAAGGCILIRREALERIGGIARIQDQLIDDCALAREVKNTGGKIWLGVTRSTRSIRPYPAFADVEHMIARTAFTQLQLLHLDAGGRNGRDVRDLPVAAGSDAGRLSAGRGRMGVDDDQLHSGIAFLWAEPAVGANAPADCALLYGCYRSFGSAFLDRSGWNVEGTRGGVPEGGLNSCFRLVQL